MGEASFAPGCAGSAGAFFAVGGCLVTGNEDGIKHCSINVLYSLQHLGYTEKSTRPSLALSSR